ncbi:MAG: hypothetical protein ABIN17_07495 [candidate division WOR-3 bacterium]
MKKEIEEILETIDILKYISQRAKKEIKHFAIYMIIFGFYISTCVFITLITEKYILWFYLLPLAFFFSTIHVSGIIFSILIWGIFSIIYFFIIPKLGIPLYISAIFIGILVTFGYYMNYYIGIKRKTYKPLNSKLSVIPKIGIFWGFAFAGIIFNIFLFYNVLGEDINKIVNPLYSYTTGMGLFVTGFVLPFFYILGIIEVIFIPLLNYINNALAYITHGIVGLLMAFYSIYLLKKKEE